MNVQHLVEKIRDYHPGIDAALVENAYEFLARCHSGQTRKSGAPYVTHPLEVASIIADMRLDLPTVVTGLLHDTVEDTLTTIEEIEASFGGEVAQLVDGVTKISRIESDSREEAEARTMRKIFIASAKDIRVLLVKLADRAHNLRTIEHLDPERQRRIARESLDIYAPLAHRLGINWLKSEFEEITFQILHPDEHAEVSKQLDINRITREGYIQEITNIISKRLLEAGIEAEVSGRPKSAYSVYRKMQSQGLHYDDVFDVVAFRILVDTDRDCYDALGIAHKQWRPVPGRFRDYVALPKANRYQSLHTTVIGPYGERMEFQLRTHEMHRVAELGIAAHWKYKTDASVDSSESERFEWLHQLLEWQQHLDDPAQYMDTVKEDLFADEVVVFTPQGQARQLPKGATVVDFAYRIHTEVGDHAAAARVNGQLVPLRHVLSSGDRVEVVTTEDATPARDWLKFVKTPRARQRILAWLKQADKTRSITLGRELLERDLARHQIDFARLNREGRMADLLKQFAAEEEKDLFAAVGYGRIRSRQVVEYLLPGVGDQEPEQRSAFRRIFGLLERSPKKETDAVEVRGIDDDLVRFGRCCYPLPGENIVGFMTRGRGVTVHARDCERLVGTDPERYVDVVWTKGARAPRTVKLEVTSRDRPGVLAQMSQAISSAGFNISRAYVRTTSEQRAINVFEITLFSADDLERVEKNLRRIPGIKGIQRLRA